jgi:hypothetical protein
VKTVYFWLAKLEIGCKSLYDENMKFILA